MARKENVLKKIFSVFMLCMAVMILASCGGSDKSAVGVNIQFCSDLMCIMGTTDADGIAAFPDQEAGAYTVHVFSVPEGYAEDATEYPMPETYGDLKITLKAAN